MSFNKAQFIKDLEEDKSNEEIPYEEDEEINEEDEEAPEFTTDFIKETISNLINELHPTFATIFDISLFLGNVAKKLSETIKNKELSIKSKYAIIMNISKIVVNELEEKGFIDLDMANEFREIFKDSESYTDIISSFSSFISSNKEQQKKIIHKTLEDISNKLLGLLL